MKKLLVAISAILILAACSQSSGDKFVGHYIGQKNCVNQSIQIQKNDGGSGYTLDITGTDNKKYSFIGTSDGNVMLTEMFGSKFSFKFDGNILSSGDCSFMKNK